MSAAQRDKGQRGSMTKALRKWSSRFHRHSWEGSAWNAYCVEAEQRCKCGARRHAMLDSSMDVPWVDGPHPIAQRLRDEGRVYSDGWTGAF